MFNINTIIKLSKYFFPSQRNILKFYIAKKKIDILYLKFVSVVSSIFVITIILIQIMDSCMYFEENRSEPLAVGNLC